MPPHRQGAVEQHEPSEEADAMKKVIPWPMNAVRAIASVPWQVFYSERISS